MGRPTDELIAGFAELQYGLVTRRQLLRAGVPARVIRGRRAAGWLRPVQRGVYQVGRLRSPRQTEMAAVLACGRGATLSHRSAAPFWKLLIQPGAGEPAEVIVAARDRRKRPGIRAYRLGPLASDEVGEVGRIPVTSPARTLLDLASVVSSRDLERAVAQADRRGLASPDEVLALVARRPTHRGARRLRALLEGGNAPLLTLSEAEGRLLDLIREAQLPRPETNVMVEGYLVDCLWRERGVIVEVDGFAHHASRRQFESDRLRDSRLAAQGFRVIRVTWRQLVREPLATAARLAQTLAHGGRQHSPVRLPVVPRFEQRRQKAGGRREQ